MVFSIMQVSERSNRERERERAKERESEREREITGSCNNVFDRILLHCVIALINDCAN